MKIIKECTLMGDNSSGSFAENGRAALLKAGFPESETEFFVEKMVSLLDDYAAFAGEGTKVKYRSWKSPVNMEFRILIPGKPFDPFTEGKGAQNRAIDKMFSVNLNNGNGLLPHTICFWEKNDKKVFYCMFRISPIWISMYEPPVVTFLSN